MASLCLPAPSSQCMGLPLPAAAAVSGGGGNSTQAKAFSNRPHLFYPSWGGATGLASRLMLAARRHATFEAVVDVGCNAGAWSQPWLRGRSPPPTVLCVEALPSLAAATRQRLNKSGSLHVINAALSNASGSKELFGLPASHKAARQQTGAGLSFSSHERGHVSLGEVPVRTLDELLRSWGLLQRGHLFVKVDTEGFDWHVVQGGACALRHGAIDILQIEWNRRKLPAAVPACVTLRRVALALERLGFSAYLVGRPYLPLNFGSWHEVYEGRRLPCPPYCTGDVVALRRGWAAGVQIAHELQSERAPPAMGSFLRRLQNHSRIAAPMARGRFGTRDTRGSIGVRGRGGEQTLETRG